MIASLSETITNKSSKIISVVKRIVPNVVQNQFVLYQVNALAKEFIKNGELEFLLNRIVKFQVSDIDVTWYFTFDGARITTTSNNDDNVCFSATLNALILLASQKVDPDTLFFSRELKITGDTELGLEIKNLIDLFEINQLPILVQTGLDKWSDILIRKKQA